MLQSVRVRTTPLWDLMPQATAVLLELPLEDTPDQATVAAAFASVRQPQAQVQFATMHMVARRPCILTACYHSVRHKHTQQDFDHAVALEEHA